MIRVWCMLLGHRWQYLDVVQTVNGRHWLMLCSRCESKELKK